jgi:hypothetical protein
MCPGDSSQGWFYYGDRYKGSPEAERVERTAPEWKNNDTIAIHVDMRIVNLYSQSNLIKYREAFLLLSMIISMR